MANETTMGGTINEYGREQVLSHNDEPAKRQNYQSRSVHAGTTDGHNQQQQQQQDQKQYLPRRHSTEEELQVLTETKAVYWLRVLVLLVLVTSAVAVVLTIFYYIKNAEQKSFETAFVDDADKVFEALGTSLYLTLGTIDAFVTSTVSLARVTNQPWPFVTVPDYAVRLSKVRSLSKSVVMQQAHFVTANQREEWENYTLAHDGWVSQSLQIQKEDPNFHGMLMDSFTPDGSIHSYMGRSEGPGPFLPTWQSSPVVPVFSAYNWNALDYTSVSQAYDELVGNQRVVISKVSNMAAKGDPISEAESFAAIDYIKDFIDPVEDPSEPLSVLNFPMIDKAADSVAIFPHDNDGQTSVRKKDTIVLGVVTSMFFWRDMLKDILPHGSDGIVCVFENQCNQTFTYELNGSDVEYLGEGDQHDSAYDEMGKSSTMYEIGSLSVSGRGYTGVPLSSNSCAYELHVYPSRENERIHHTNNTVVFTVSAVMIFLFTSLVFLTYDICVQRRQRKVMNTAAESNQNVSLLEGMVLERTRKLEDSNARLKEANRKVVAASDAQLKHFACMSHEIRTPLNCIIGLSSLLQETDLSPMQGDSMQMIVNSGDLLLAVVNDVLDFSKLESGDVEVQIKNSNLQECLNSVVHSIDAKGMSKEISVRTKYDPSIPEFISIDMRRLQQVLYNILGNAVKYGQSSSKIDLEVSLVTEPSNVHVLEGVETIQQDSTILDEIDLESGTRETSKTFSSLRSADDATYNGEKPWIRFVVRNVGDGIDPKDFGKIFEPFQQATTESEKVFGGTGLGLAITAKLVKLLGGSISVDSKVGEWTSFSVELPFHDERVDTSAISHKLRDSTILLIDNDVDNVHRILAVCRECKIDVTHFDHFQALSNAAEHVGFLRPGRKYVCLAREDLFDGDALQRLARLANQVLVTFGPNYIVKESKCHFRSLSHALPSVVLGSLISLVETVAVPTELTLLQEGIALARQPVDSSQLRSSTNNAVPYLSMRVLIAEDNKINQKVLLRILNRLGLENVDIVDNGLEAVQIEAEKPFDVILMDMQMPVMDGVEACRLILNGNNDIASAGHSKPKIVFVTAHVSEEFENECRTAGAVDFIPKPFRKDDIHSCFQKLCNATHFGIESA